MRRKLQFFLSLIVMLLLHTVQTLAATVTLPTEGSLTLNWGDATLTNCSSENSGANIGSTHSGSQAVFSLTTTAATSYVMTFKTGAKNLTAELQVTLTGTNGTVVDKTVTVENTGAWTPATLHTTAIDDLPAGDYTLTFNVLSSTGSYAGNYGELIFAVADDYATIPGTLALADGTYSGSIRGENSYDNIGWIVNGDKATYTFKNTQAGVYSFNSAINGYCNDGAIAFTVTDLKTGTVEAETTYNLQYDGAYIDREIVLPGVISTGTKTLTMAFSNSSSWVCNYKAITMAYKAADIADLKGVSISGATTEAGADTDWFIQLSSVDGDAITLNTTSLNAALAATAVDGSGNAITVTDNDDGTFSIPTLAPGGSAVVTFTLTATGEAYQYRDTWTVRIYRVGEITISSLKIDGQTVDVPAALNEDGNTATLSGNIYTAKPTATATLVDNSTVDATVTVSGSTATAVFNAQVGSMQKTFTLLIEGVNIYTAADDEETVTLKYTSDGKVGDGNWSDGVYTLESSSLDGWSGSQFKFNSTVNTLCVPADIQVKQLTLVNFYSNYTPTDGKVLSVTSDGATAILPTYSGYQQGSGTQYDLYIPIQNHTAGQPITITMQGGGQPVAWFDLTVKKVAVVTAPVLQSQTVTSTASSNHCVVTLTYDRVMQDATATIGTQTVKAQGGGTSLCFSVWNLDYNTDYTFTLPAANATDEYGNKLDADVEIAISVGSKATAEKAVYDYVVGTAEEFQAAVAAVNASNTSATSARKTIFIKNGDYDFGSTEQRITGYNVSLIGESSDGVVLHGTRSGISNPVLNLRDRTGFYLQDLTVRNDFDWRAGSFSGVAVAIYGGNKTAMKNVVMQSNQDTQVTGERAYFEDCTIHGTVDFICGGGDNFYSGTRLVLEDRAGDVIAAPATGSALQWGYVFQNCTIEAADGATNVTDGSYNLGRPWQNEPRIYFLNTTMKVLPTAAGWTNMSNLTTHFYEYNSMTADGTAIDLSSRQNSPSHVGEAYTPVLSAEQAAEFTVENVLGGTDSWLATEETAEVSAPVVTLTGNTLAWTDDSDARTYVILKDGSYLANTTATTYSLTEDGTYTVCAANKNGGMGHASDDVVYAAPVVESVEIAVSAAGYATFASEYATDFTDNSQVEAYTVDVDAEGILTLTKATLVAAGEGVLIKSLSGAAVNAEVAVTSAEVAKVEGNDLVATMTDIESLATDNEDGTYYILNNGTNGVGFYQANNQRVRAGRAYLRLPKTLSAKTVRFIALNEATGVETLSAATDAAAQGKAYNMAGQRVSAAATGVIIVDGKKYSVKY